MTTVWELVKLLLYRTPWRTHPLKDRNFWRLLLNFCVALLNVARNGATFGLVYQLFRKSKAIP